MTNLEFYKDEIKVAFVHDEYLCDSIRRVASRYGYDTKGFVSEGKVIDWLLEEHKEPIKLTKFEYDLLKCYQETKDDGEFEDHYILKEMQYKGHFQDVDYNLTLKEILDNCEVVD